LLFHELFNYSNINHQLQGIYCVNNAGMEITGEKWRTFVGINLQAVFALGYMALSGFAYEWRDWRYLQFAISFVPIPFLFFWFFLPESPR